MEIAHAGEGFQKDVMVGRVGGTSTTQATPKAPLAWRW